MTSYILSTEFESSTDEVMDWLWYLSKTRSSVQRINSINLFGDALAVRLSEAGTVVKYNEQSIDPKRTWFRKGFRFEVEDSSENSGFGEHLNSEIREFYSSLKFAIGVGCLVNPTQATPNKFHVLAEAQKVGFHVPQTILTNAKSELDQFFDAGISLISKPIGDLPGLPPSQINGMYLNTRVNKKERLALPDFFYPTCFQEEIDKEFEVRSFVIENEVYSMAIFSQGNQKTEVDFRNYSQDRPNRTVPYGLPKKEEQNLLTLFTTLKMNCGSVDFIKSTNGKLYFLEINPAGQFGMVSKPCNYYLEKRIAQHLLRQS